MKRRRTSRGQADLPDARPLDGYAADEKGESGWAWPDEEVHRFVNDLRAPSALTSTGAGCTR